MDTFLVLKDIHAEGCNGKQGDLLFGFPSMSGFLGFVHCMQLELSKELDLDIRLEHIAVINHLTTQNMERNDSGSEYGKYAFNICKKPLLENGDTPSFITEVKVNLVCSLIIRLPEELRNEISIRGDLIPLVEKFVTTHHLCGGHITYCDVKSCTNQDFEIIKKKVGGNVIIPVTKVDNESENLTLDSYLQTYIESFEGYVHGEKYIVPMEVGYRILDEIKTCTGCKCAFRHELTEGDVLTKAESVYAFAEWVDLRKISSFDEISWQYTATEDYLLFSNKIF